MIRLLAIAAIAFKIWMFIDALRRRAETYWLWVIIMVPGGAWAYLFMVKLRDRDVRQLGQRMLESLKRPPSVDELRGEYERSPSLANRVRLAQGLYDTGEYEQARTLFEDVLGEQPNNRDGLYGLGLSRLESGDLAGAVEPLSKLLDEHPRYRDYAAWPALARAHFEQGEQDECLALLEDLVRAAPRLPHQVLQARYLRRVGKNTHARQVLEDGLAEYQRASKHVRRDQRTAARQARAMLRDETSA